MRETKQVNKMSDVYKNCPAFENDRFLLRFSQLNDASGFVPIHLNGLSDGQLLTKKRIKPSAQLKCFIAVQTMILIM